MTLRELKTGQSAVIESVGGEGATRQHFLDMGVIPGAEVTLIKFAPMGDPMELRIHGYELTLRLSEAEKIGIKTDKKMVVDTVVRKNAEREKEAAALRDKPERSKSKKSHHPGLGEGGIFHEKSTEKPLSYHIETACLLTRK